MATGLLISSSGGSMIWPFLMIYVSEKLQLPVGSAAALLSLNAAMSLASSFAAGWVADRLGRKGVMVVSLLANGLMYFLLGRATTYLEFVLLMLLAGASNPLYQVGSDAMLADLVVSEKRTGAYAILRMVNNAGIAIGPAVGGFVAALSYTYAFWGAALGMTIYGLLLLFKARETLVRSRIPHQKSPREPFGGFGRVFGDRAYIRFALLVGLGLIAPSIMWNLLAVYTKQNYGLSEQLYGWLPTTNALMCVFIQYPVTRIARRHRPLRVMAIGMLIYALGVGSVVLMSGFWGFWLSMVLMTFGELTLIPVVSKYIADLAPPDARGRYMSFYWFAWGLARTLAPLLGGWLNDNASPRSIWYGGLSIGLLSGTGLAFLAVRDRAYQPEESSNLSSFTG